MWYPPIHHIPPLKHAPQNIFPQRYIDFQFTPHNLHHKSSVFWYITLKQTATFEVKCYWFVPYLLRPRFLHIQTDQNFRLDVILFQNKFLNKLDHTSSFLFHIPDLLYIMSSSQNLTTKFAHFSSHTIHTIFFVLDAS